MNPIGKMKRGRRLDALTAEGGISGFGDAKLREGVSRKKIPLATAIARAGGRHLAYAQEMAG